MNVTDNSYVNKHAFIRVHNKDYSFNKLFTPKQLKDKFGLVTANKAIRAFFNSGMQSHTTKLRTGFRIRIISR